MVSVKKEMQACTPVTVVLRSPAMSLMATLMAEVL